MKIAVSGKGGVGKSTFAAALALSIAKKGGRVLALDADPDANLASALGIPHADQEKKIVPISRQIELIEERTGTSVEQYGKVFKMNPHVADVADGYSYEHNGVFLLVLGAVKRGGGGCACPESTFIRALVTDLVMYKNETLIMDMEAGIEHLGRGTSEGVDVMVIVVEPGQRSIDCANTVIRMSEEIGVKKVAIVANKVANADEEKFIRDNLLGQNILAVIPMSDTIRSADRDGVSVLDVLDEPLKQVFNDIFQKIEEM